MTSETSAKEVLVQRLALAREKRKGCPVIQLNPREKMEKKPTPLNAIKAKCFECMGDGWETGWKEEIRNCSSKTCTLHGFRPYK